MKDKSFESHAISEVFPLMPDNEMSELTTDIKTNGLRNPVILYEGKVLDGRNRVLACQKAGVKIRTTQFTGDRLAALAMVWSGNFHRRHLNPSQVAVAEAKRAKMCQEYAAEVEKMKAEAKEKQKEAGHKGKEHGKKGGRGKKKPLTELIPQGVSEKKRSEKEKKLTSTKRAKAVGTNRKYLETAEKLLDDNPEKLEAVEKGEKSLAEVIRESKKEDKERKRQEAIERGKQLTNDTVFVQSIENLSLEKDSVDLIITDPPYSDESVKTYEILARVASECLKPGSFCCCYTGKLRLPDVVIAMTKHLEYVWCIAVFHPFSKEKHLGSPYQFAENWRPVLVFKKAGKPAVCNFQQDVVRAERDKDFHDWQQDLQTPSQLIEAYTEPEGLVVDPFCGGGTTLVAAKRLGRRWLGFDVSEESVALSKERLGTNWWDVQSKG